MTIGALELGAWSLECSALQVQTAIQDVATLPCPVSRLPRALFESVRSSTALRLSSEFHQSVYAYCTLDARYLAQSTIELSEVQVTTSGVSHSCTLRNLT